MLCLVQEELQARVEIPGTWFVTRGSGSQSSMTENIISEPGWIIEGQLYQYGALIGTNRYRRNAINWWNEPYKWK